LLAYIRLGWKLKTEANTLAYDDSAIITSVKGFTVQAQVSADDVRDTWKIKLKLKKQNSPQSEKNDAAIEPMPLLLVAGVGAVVKHWHWTKVERLFR
jgi:hypothetical protein